MPVPAVPEADQLALGPNCLGLITSTATTTIPSNARVSRSSIATSAAVPVPLQQIEMCKGLSRCHTCCCFKSARQTCRSFKAKQHHCRLSESTSNDYYQHVCHQESTTTIMRDR
eukprot:GHUV01048758.1.p1 GENE.GHUV01048758.1~~GHUV01048758.1.p1  ORF type:complete len:114 (-),score=13.49 GHUV01048758.1:162-503(-)